MEIVKIKITFSINISDTVNDRLVDIHDGDGRVVFRTLYMISNSIHDGIEYETS